MPTKGRAVVAGLTAVSGCVVLGLIAAAGHQSVLFQQPFDSDLPVQWDSNVRDGDVDLGGLSRYYSAASAHLRHAAPEAHRALKQGQAREMQLVQIPRSSGMKHQPHLRKWSPEHLMNVEASRVDDETVKGLWKNKDEAWAGIDKVFPTDTRYEYETLHSGHGQEAKMQAFLDHAHNQLKLLNDDLPTLAADTHSTKELRALHDAISEGEDALKKIEHDTVEDDAKHAHVELHDDLPKPSDADLGLSDEFKVARGSQLRQQSAQARDATPIDYENARAAQSDMNSYFDALDKATLRENVVDASRAAGSFVRRRVEAERFMQALASVLKPVQRQQLQSSGSSCGMCIAVMGCKDCCELFCSDEVAAGAKPVPKCPVNGGEGDADGDAADAACDESGRGEAEAESRLESEVQTLRGEVDNLQQQQQQQNEKKGKGVAKARQGLSRIPCECTTPECRECPESDYSVRVRRAGAAFRARQATRMRQYNYPGINAKAVEDVKGVATGLGSGSMRGSREPCDCEDAECGNCPRYRMRRGRGTRRDVAAKVAATARENRALIKAGEAVAKSNAILKARVAALEATNALALRQGLGVYGPESGDDSKWQAREPFPGRSETFGTTVSRPIWRLQKQLFGLRRQVGRLAGRVREHHAQKRGWYVQKGRADEDVLPFYEQPAYGGKHVAKLVRAYARRQAEGDVRPY